MGERVYAEDHEQQYDWSNVGTLSAAASAPTTNKSRKVVEALESVVDTLEDGTKAVNYRFLCDSDGDSNVLNMYAMRGDDHYTLIATLTLTGGTQVDGSIGVFVDTIVVTNEQWPTEIAVQNDAANGIANIALYTHGYSKFLFLATTFADAEVKVEKARMT